MDILATLVYPTIDSGITITYLTLYNGLMKLVIPLSRVDKLATLVYPTLDSGITITSTA